MIALTLALGTALLFGLSAPAAKLLGGAPWTPRVAAGLLYLWSVVGSPWCASFSAICAVPAARPASPIGIFPGLLGAVLAGGIVGPVLMFGLARGLMAN